MNISPLAVRAGIPVAIGMLAALLSTVPSLQWLALVVVIGAMGFLGLLIFRQATEAAAQRTDSDELRRMNIDLEGRAQAGTAEALASGERLRSIIDSAVDGIIVIDETGRIESFNPAAERLFGYDRSEVLGRNVSMLMPSPYHEEHDTYVARYLATGRAKIIGIGREVAGRRRDGSVFPLHLSVGEMTIGGAKKFTGILHDLTGRVRLEEQLRERAALARVGEMAAVIAHEVKNPLAGIRGALQVIAGRLPADSRDATVLSDIVKRIDALDSLMKDVLLFARAPQPRRAAVDVVPLVTMTADLLCRDPSLSDVEVAVEGSAPPVLVDPEMLKIVFHNLLVNSAHAMQGHGRIDVAIGTIDGTCQIAFTDTGPGIPPEIRDKIFTAFFTTKSRGSGLGLATAKRLVEAHEGAIQVDYPEGGGTRVIVRIPTQAAEPRE
jgi:two-component system, LuxR family, sensor kinase FixL